MIESLEASHTETIECSHCGGISHKQLPKRLSSTIMETKDRYQGKKLMKNQDQMMKKRLREHDARYGMETKIETHGIDEAVKNGWTKKIKRT